MAGRGSGGIARRIALASVLISAASGLGLGGISAYGDFRRSFATAVENAERVLRAAVPQLESAYWDLDLAASQTTVDRLAEAPLVRSVHIRDLVFTTDDLPAVNIGPLAAQSELPAEPRAPLARLVPQEWLSDRLEFDLSAPRSREPIARLEVTLSFAELYDELGRRAMTVVATTVLQALLIAGILFVLIRSLIITPLNGLSRAARAQREGGGFRLTGKAAELLSERRDDEIASLARDFTLTVNRMERYRDNLREQVEQRTAELVLARNDALAASRAKSRFLANMSHELRTPLHAITGLSELILSERLPAAAQRHVADMRSAARQLLGSIDTVLDLSKLEAGHMVFGRASFAPEEVFDEVLSQTRVLIGARPVLLEGDIASDVPGRVWGDPQRVMQILLNLTSNAVKFTQSGRIRLRIQRRGDRLRFLVTDTGPGIAREHQEAVFAPFAQGDESTSRRVSGTGLGLSIARQMAEGMGGALRLRSHPGRGSLFVLDLPLEEDAGAPAASPVPRPRLDLPPGRLRRRIARLLDRLPAGDEQSGLVLGGAPQGLLLTAPSGAAENLPLALTHRELRSAIDSAVSAGAGEAAPCPELLALKERRVLLVEDQQINRSVTEALLARAGIRVMAAAGGAEALRMVPAVRPDLILTDLHMPGIDGFATVRELRGRGFGDLPVVACSADVSVGTREACAAAGFAGFVAKPLTRESLFATLTRVLGRAQPPLDPDILARNTAGDPALADRWLSMLPAEISGWRQMLAGAVPPDEALHAIRGAAIQLGATELHHVCSEADADPRRVLAALDRLEAALAGRETAPPPAASGREASPSLLAECISALRHHQMAGFDLLEDLAPAFPAGRAAELREAAAQLDFRRAARLLEQA